MSKAKPQRRHSFTPKDRAKSAKARQEAPKTINFAEAKRLLCERLRDSETDAGSFVKLFVIYMRKFQKLNRPRRKAELHEIVQQIEAGRRPHAVE